MCPLDTRMWTQCDNQSSFQFQIWWKNSRVVKLLLWCQKYFSTTPRDTSTKRDIQSDHGTMMPRQVKDKLKGSLSVLSTMIGWHGAWHPARCDVTWILGLRQGWVTRRWGDIALCWAQLWLRLPASFCLLSVDLMCANMKIIHLTCHCLSTMHHVGHSLYYQLSVPINPWSCVLIKWRGQRWAIVPVSW